MTPPTRRSHLATAAALSALAACWYPADRGQQLEMKLERLQADNKEMAEALEAQKKAMAAQGPKIEAKVKEVEQALAALDKASRRSSADVGVQVEKLIQDLQELRGLVEGYTHRLDVVEKGSSEAKDAYDKKLAEFEKGLNDFKSSEVGKQLAAKAKLEAIKRPDDKKAYLELATKYLGEDKGIGRVLMAEWLKKWGADPLAAQAHYTLGDMLQDDGRCRDALEEYGAIVKSFPKASQAGDALVRSSACFAELKMMEEARIALEETVRNYPKSEAAKKAQKRLEEMKKEARAGKKK